MASLWESQTNTLATGNDLFNKARSTWNTYNDLCKKARFSDPKTLSELHLAAQIAWDDWRKIVRQYSEFPLGSACWATITGQVGDPLKIIRVVCFVQNFLY